MGLLAVVLAGALVVGACGGAAEDLGKAAQDLEDVASAIDEATDDGMTSDDGGSAEVVAVSLPEGWPAEFPTPDGAIPTWERSGESTTGPYMDYEAIFSSDLSDEDLMTFFDEALPAAGWTIGDRYTEDSDGLPSFGFQVAKDDYWSGTISIGTDVGVVAEGNIYVSLGHPIES